MEDSTLKERLLNSQKSFDGLLSLIPAKMYYGEETSDQWKRKKQTKAEAAAARRNKLDPDSELNRSVKEVMDEQAQKKRKRDQMQDGDEDDWSDVDGVETEKPGEGLKKKASKDAKKKLKKSDEEQPELSEKERRKEEKKAARKERKAERQLLREEEAAFQRQTIKGVNKIKLGSRETRPDAVPSDDAQVTDINRDDNDAKPSDVKDLDVAGLVDPADEQNSTSAPSPPSEPQSPIFDTNGTPADSTGQAPSTTTSVSSTAPAPAEKPKHIKVPTDDTNLRARLAARLQALREARKADVDGKPIRTRQELIEARRQKQAERKAHKKELRRQAKVEADRKREEALASARNSPGSILSPAIDLDDNNFSFGRVGFGDGSQLSHDLTHVLNGAKKKGPSDPKTALQKLENQKKRLEGMDEEKRKDVEDKELWLTARRRAEGEKIKDDEKLLKKAVKRKETAKKKSEKDWTARKEGVAKSMKDRQKKREENIRKRRDEKLLGKAGKKKGAKKSKGRAGFEGSFIGGGKKK
ncbi:SURF6-domain-containing protein [Annulohypoxylon truncatum]|uniref:SURF6-domain-containing protein n=1 Tax=Annulohypoxylon truncatum TaxID=327061 RepID=UPI0020073055|nr:SURF6-domain-containing protein [Annulohypoxylon truncatum]KAI1210080.1 SURF6-domain-containing protein [Annulohypoxylon truncatum]